VIGRCGTISRMRRPLFVRTIGEDERKQLESGLRSTDAFVLRRCQILLASISFLFLFPITSASAGLDVGRLGWSPPLPLSLRLLALLLFTLGNVLGGWAMATNRFFSTFVRIQKDRSHEVVTGGPYRYVRHPGYADAILAAITLPLALGSLWALIPACTGAAGFIVRGEWEDRMLRQELGGYVEYAGRVRHRLIPGIWWGNVPVNHEGERGFVPLLHRTPTGSTRRR
jgi:protein-S-isoprenylcysteine O-methyltransferase Ste14